MDKVLLLLGCPCKEKRHEQDEEKTGKRYWFRLGKIRNSTGFALVYRKAASQRGDRKLMFHWNRATRGANANVKNDERLGSTTGTVSR